MKVNLFHFPYRAKENCCVLDIEMSQTQNVILETGVCDCNIVQITIIYSIIFLKNLISIQNNLYKYELETTTFDQEYMKFF